MRFYNPRSRRVRPALSLIRRRRAARRMEALRMQSRSTRRPTLGRRPIISRHPVLRSGIARGVRRPVSRVNRPVISRRPALRPRLGVTAPRLRRAPILRAPLRRRALGGVRRPVTRFESVTRRPMRPVVRRPISRVAPRPVVRRTATRRPAIRPKAQTLRPIAKRVIKHSGSARPVVRRTATRRPAIRRNSVPRPLARKQTTVESRMLKHAIR